MSKYTPLQRFLESRPATEVAMTFEEVERVLGFALPDSARNYAAWWSNNTGTHVGVKAWRDIGWKTSRVSLGDERVTFVREQPIVREVGEKTVRPPDVVEALSNHMHDDGRDRLQFDELSPAVRNWLDPMREGLGLDKRAAMEMALENWAMDQRRRFVESLPRVQMPPGYDSTDIVRADRDSRR